MDKTAKKLVENLSNHILDKYEDRISNINAKFVKIDDSPMGRKAFIEEHIKIKDLSEADCIDVADWGSQDKKEFFNKVLDTIGAYLIQEKSESFQHKDIPEIEIDRNSLVPVLNIKTDEVVLFNKKTNRISEMSFSAWERKLSKEERGIVHTTMRDALFTYDPYNIDTFVPIEWEGMEALKVNTYTPPPWRKKPEPEDLEMPDIFERFFRHLFPTWEGRRYVYHWMHIAMVKRNETYLVLNGRKGVGKGVFTAILAALVGREHYTEAPASLLTSQFNAALDKKRVINMDEFKVGKSEHTKLKRFINKYQTIEKKGVDADKASEIYNSYVIANNDMVDMHIETDDRRFSVPEIADENLTKSLSKEEIDFIVRESEDDDSEVITQLGYYIFRKGRAQDMNEFSVYRGQRFWDLAYTSLTEWQKYLVDLLVTGNFEEDAIAINEIRKQFLRENKNDRAFFPTNISRIRDFFKNYDHRGQGILATVEKRDGEDGKTHYIVPEELTYKEQEEEDL